MVEKAPAYSIRSNWAMMRGASELKPSSKKHCLTNVAILRKVIPSRMGTVIHLVIFIKIMKMKTQEKEDASESSWDLSLTGTFKIGETTLTGKATYKTPSKSYQIYRAPAQDHKRAFIQKYKRYVFGRSATLVGYQRYTSNQPNDNQVYTVAVNEPVTLSGTPYDTTRIVGPFVYQDCCE